MEINEKVISFPNERRVEARQDAEGFYSVEIKAAETLPIYQFKLRDVSENGACIFVKEKSELLDFLKIGQIMDMKYYSSDPMNPVQFIKTEIKHITQTDENRHKGHCLIGLKILEKKLVS